MKTLFITARTQKKFLLLTAALSLCSIGAFAQDQPVQDTTKVSGEDYKMDEVLVSAIRVDKKAPVTFSNISKEEIAPRNLGQDIPILLNYMPSVVTTTDAGNGIGYTSMRVRGSDATRINVTLNGIPFNDSESQGSFWVNQGDFASSVENIQLQRGVGTSTNGAGAFGASLNLLTDAFSKKANAEISGSYGSFNSRKNTVKFSTGLIDDHIEIAGRLSNIVSDGYIDRASSNLKSYFLQGTYVGKTTLIKALAFGGKEKTYQAWNGIDAETLANDRQFNYSGMYTDADGNVQFYDNETDNYQQDHYQLHWNERWSDNWSTNLAFHYTIGKGYYENYNSDAPLANFGIDDIVIGTETITSSDLITQKWLDNDFYGTTFSANYKKDNWNVVMGGAWNKYEGAHFGQIIWSRYNQPDAEITDHYYDDDAIKTDFNVFTKANWQVTEKINLFGDLQYRRVGYEADGVLADPVDDTFNFFNPKAGITYTVNNRNNIYFSYARANKEPRRNDYENGSSKPESLNDFELGWRYSSPKFVLNANGYYMRYKDQLVLTGALNDVGAPVYTNSGDSYRLGFEADATIFVTNKFIIKPNVALSDNKNLNFHDETENGPVNLGDTKIAFSPDIIAGNQLIFIPVKSFQIALLSKYVGKQFMNNIEQPSAELDSYFVNDLNLSYELKLNTALKSIVFNGLVNNIFDTQYVSNGFMYGDPYYYPQAGINFLVGATLKF